MAAVYLAHERILDRYVAMKVMSPALLTGLGMVERFQREARTVAKLVHPNIITIHTVRQVDDLHFFTMQFVDGRSLDHILKDAGRLPVAMVRGLLFTIGGALAHAHRRGVVHRDVKPANVLVSSEGVAIVTDFGIAKVAQDSVDSHTQTNAIVGTPAYISPEQCYSHPATAASDQYSLGVMAYELLTGRPPYTGSAFAVMQAHTEQAAPPIRPTRPDCPPELETSVLRMLEKDPANRWTTMQHALAELGAAPLAEDDPMRRALIDLAVAESDDRAIITTRSVSKRSVPNVSSLFRSDPEAKPASIAILAPHDPIEVGDVVTLSASVRNAGGNTLPGVHVTWAGDDTAVASVDSARGKVVALAPGEVSITASCDGAKHTVRLQIIPRRVAAVNISMPPGTIRVGDRVRLVAKAEDGAHNPVDESIHWMIGDADIAGVAADGTLTAKAVGMTLVWAEAQGVRASARVEINPAAVATLRIVSPKTSLEVGETMRLEATPFDAHDERCLNRIVTWQTTDTDIATVTSEGLVEARRAGVVRVNASCEGKTATVLLTVDKAKAVAVIIVGQPREAIVGQPFVLTAQAIDGRGFALERRFRWVAEPKRILDVKRDGKMTPVAPGMVTIRAITEDGEDSVTVDVVAAPIIPELVRQIDGPEVAPDSAPAMSASSWLRPRKSHRPILIASGGVLLAIALVWASMKGAAGGGDSEKAPSPRPESTTVASPPTPPQPQPTTPTVAPAGEQTSVPRAPVAKIAIIGLRSNVLPGDAFTLTATLRDARDSVLRDRTVRWRSTVPEVATIDPSSGYVTAKKDGETVIVAQAERHTQRATLLVTKAVAELPPRIAVDASAHTVRVYGSLFLSARTSGGPPTGTRSVGWTSNAPGVARVDSSGRVTGIGVGAVTIVGRWRGVADSVRITVSAPAVASIAVAPPTLQLTEGEAIRLRATIKDERNNAMPIGALRWRSENPQVAGVDSAGLVTGLGPGMTGIIATDEVTARVPVTVVAKPVAAPPATVPADRTAVDRVMAAKVTEFIALINADKDDALKAIVTDAARYKELTEVRRRATAPQIGATQLNDNRATADFKTTLSWRSGIGKSHTLAVPCQAILVLRGDTWVLQEIRILNKIE